MNGCVLNYSFTFSYLDCSIPVVERVFFPVNLVVPALPLLLFAFINGSRRRGDRKQQIWVQQMLKNIEIKVISHHFLYYVHKTVCVDERRRENMSG